jgi:hypothetical protein
MSRSDHKGKPDAIASHSEKDSTSLVMFEIGNPVKNEKAFRAVSEEAVDKNVGTVVHVLTLCRLPIELIGAGDGRWTFAMTNGIRIMNTKESVEDFLSNEQKGGLKPIVPGLFGVTTPSKEEGNQDFLFSPSKVRAQNSVIAKQELDINAEKSDLLSKKLKLNVELEKIKSKMYDLKKKIKVAKKIGEEEAENKSDWETELDLLLEESCIKQAEIDGIVQELTSIEKLVQEIKTQKLRTQMKNEEKLYEDAIKHSEAVQKVILSMCKRLSKSERSGIEQDAVLNSAVNRSDLVFFLFRFRQLLVGSASDTQFQKMDLEKRWLNCKFPADNSMEFGDWLGRVVKIQQEYVSLEDHNGDAYQVGVMRRLIADNDLLSPLVNNWLLNKSLLPTNFFDIVEELRKFYGDTKERFIAARSARINSAKVFAAQQRSLKDLKNDGSSSSSAVSTTVNSGTSKNACHEFVKSGSCKYGDKCRFAHSKSTSVKTDVKENKVEGKLNVCFQMLNHGECKFGEKCNFKEFHTASKTCFDALAKK